MRKADGHRSTTAASGVVAFVGQFGSPARLEKKSQGWRACRDPMMRAAGDGLVEGFARL
jgi:hypothetical protein